MTNGPADPGGVLPPDPDDPADVGDLAWDAGNLGLPVDPPDAVEDDPTGEIAAATADLDEDVPAGTTTIVPWSPRQEVAGTPVRSGVNVNSYRGVSRGAGWKWR